MEDLRISRRQILKGAGAAGVLGALGTPAVFAGSGGEMGFIFVAPTKAVSGPFVGDVAILSGSGKFGEDDAEGGGRLTHFRPSTGAVIGTGSWRAKKLVSFVQAGTTFGAHAAGVATIEIVIRPDSGGKVPATLRIACNLPGPGRTTAFPEGIDFTSGIGHFATAGGTTAFTPGVED